MKSILKISSLLVFILCGPLSANDNPNACVAAVAVRTQNFTKYDVTVRCKDDPDLEMTIKANSEIKRRLEHTGAGDWEQVTNTDKVRIKVDGASNMIKVLEIDQNASGE